MERSPLQLNFGYNEGRALDCIIGDDWLALPATFPTNRTLATLAYETIKGPSLWVRCEDKKSIIPFCWGGKTTTNTTTTSIVFANEGEASHFRVGDLISFYDVSTGAFSTNTTTVSTVVAATNTITCSALTGLEADGDLVFICSGVDIGKAVSGASVTMASLSQNACIVLEDVLLTRNIEAGTKAYIQGTFVKSKIKGLYHTVSGTDYSIFNTANNNSLHFVDIIT